MRIASGFLLVTFLVVGGVFTTPAVAVAQSRPSPPTDAVWACDADSLLKRPVDRETAAPGQPTPDDRLLELARQRRRWQAEQPATYRLCVITLNDLLTTVREVDVVGGEIRFARGASGRHAGLEPLGPDEWAPDPGVTVEGLFDQIERGLRQLLLPPADSKDQGRHRFLVVPTYDRQQGYPTTIATAPDAPPGTVFDADVLALVRVMPSPVDPLTPVLIGEAYSDVRQARITRRLSIYDTLFGFGSPAHDDRVRVLWPDLWPTILERGNATYWRKVGWRPQAGQVGRLLGTVKINSGATIYLMELDHNEAPLYLPIMKDAVDHIR